MRTGRSGIVAVAGALAALALAGCGGASSPQEAAQENADETTGATTPGGGDVPDFPAGSTMAKLAEAGSITVGTKFDQPLFGLMGPNGVPEGFDVEIATLLAGELGISPENITWTETVSQNRESFIQNGQVDIVVATYTINDDRKKSVDFAGPYYVAGQSILTRKDDTDIQGPDDLAGKQVCTVAGSTPEKNLLDSYPDATVVPFTTYAECLEPLRNGQVDAVSTDNVILAGFAAENPDLEVRGEPFTKEPYGIGLKKGDDEFRSWINDTLEKIEKDGRWAKAWEDTAGTVLPTPEPPAVDRY